ncbi:AI-2E family transporter [Amycolatopsis palatopharyngis]|uniref:AI-2E family transporter n=1 Tax=Amycolatopsis palatopharyngis TaxID=187982 RepID=UPI0013BE8F11|nr:AI-2E family transporter [Amycolatopsis palatopharyngis]
MLDHPALRRVGAHSWAALGIVGIAVVAWFVLSRLSIVVVPLLLALFPAAALSPAAEWLKSHGVPRALSALLVVLGGFAVLSGIFAAIVPPFIAQAPGLADSVGQAFVRLEPTVQKLPGVGSDTSLAELAEQVMGSWSGLAAGVGRDLLNVLTGLVLLIVALFFYLYDGGRMVHGILRLAPRQHRGIAREVAERLWATIGGFLRGQTIVALIDAVLIGLGLALLQVPLALPLAVLVFFGAYLPFIGAVLTGLLATLVALADSGPALALATLGIVVAVQQVEGNLIEPAVMGRVVRLPPFAVIVAISAGATLLGVLGAFLAVPATAAAVQMAEIARERINHTDPDPDPDPGTGTDTGTDEGEAPNPSPA